MDIGETVVGIGVRQEMAVTVGPENQAGGVSARHPGKAAHRKQGDIDRHEHSIHVGTVAASRFGAHTHPRVAMYLLTTAVPGPMPAR
ncbi:hypothetical protein KXR53_14695 [Inquilinus limosus]|uniref:hypothetical protein n=1 Tax=Inquilinus limosus TaxID=171674 RepID=UPI003F177297